MSVPAALIMNQNHSLLFFSSQLMCCPGSNALKTWQAQPITHTQESVMAVSLGVLMPPWDTKAFLHIHVNQNVPIAVVRDFVSLLQRNAAGLK